MATRSRSSLSVPQNFDRGVVEVQVEHGANLLEELADTLYAATVRYENAEAAWDRLVLLQEAHLIHDSKRQGERVPGERTRLALIMEIHGESEEYLEYAAAKAQNAALDKKHRALAASVNARQSLLKRQS